MKPPRWMAFDAESRRAKLDSERVAMVLPLLLAVIAYSNSLYNGFAFDDVPIIENNARVHRIFDLAGIWLTPYWPYVNGESFGLYRPLTIFGYAIQWMYSGGEPFLFHLINVLLHTGVTFGVFALLRRLDFDAAACALGAAVFAVHPVHVEVVANVVGQAELISTGAILAACVVYLDRDGDSFSLPRALAISGLYLIGLLSKENAIVLPALLVALELARRRLRGHRLTRRVLTEAGTLLSLIAAVAFAYLALRIEILGSIGGTDAAPSLPFLRGDDRFLSALRAWPEFVRLMFWPMDLVPDYAPGVILPVESFTPMAILGLLLLVGTIALGLLTPCLPRIGLPAAWFFICILPVSNLILPIGVLLAERTLYMPSVGLSIMAAGVAGLSGLQLRPPARRALGVGAAAILVAFTAKTIARNPVWHSTDTLLDAMLENHPESYRAQWRAAVREAEYGNYSQSLYHWRLGFSIWPRSSAFIVEYAGFHLNHDQPGRAAELARIGLQEDPQSDRLRAVLAGALLKMHQYEEALEAVRALMADIGPEPIVLRLRARALTGKGSGRVAVEAWRDALRVTPATASDWIAYASALHQAGMHEEALRALDAAEARAEGDIALIRTIRSGREDIRSAQAQAGS